MARWYYNPNRRVRRVVTLEERVERFRDYRMNWGKSLGESLSAYFVRWREARDGGVTDYEASCRLLNQAPPGWRGWIRTHMIDLLTHDSITYAPVIEFSRLVSRVFIQWTISEEPPIPAEMDPTSEQGVPLAVEIERPQSPRERTTGGVELGAAPFKRCKNDHEAGPSRVAERKTLQQESSDVIVISDTTAPPPASDPRPPGPRRVRHTAQDIVRRTARMRIPPPPPQIPLSFLQHAERMWNETDGEQQLQTEDDDDEDEDEEQEVDQPGGDPADEQDETEPDEE